jgi:hypothetical protein
MNKATGKALKVNGQTVTAEKTFTPDKADGTVEMTFTLNSTDLAGVTTVVFEKLYLESSNRLVASHENLKDKKQTVAFKDVTLKTHATDGTKSSQSIAPEEKVTIVDTVTYDGLVVGKKYTVSGVLMDKETGKVLTVDGKQVTGQTTFKAEAESGSVEVTFTLDASALEGKTIVVFESLLYDGREIASHADLGDADQSVTVTKPGDSTTTTTSPKTGDTTNMALWIFLAVGAALVMAVVYRKKRQAV